MSTHLRSLRITYYIRSAYPATRSYHCDAITYMYVKFCRHDLVKHTLFPLVRLCDPDLRQSI